MRFKGANNIFKFSNIMPRNSLLNYFVKLDIMGPTSATDFAHSSVINHLVWGKQGDFPLKNAENRAKVLKINPNFYHKV